MNSKSGNELQGVKLITNNNKTHEMLCIICQKNKKEIPSIGIAAGRKIILKSAEKKMIWFWQEFDPQIQVIHLFIIQAIFAISHKSSPKRNHSMKMKV